MADGTPELAPWFHRVLAIIEAETEATRLPYVPEITLRLAPETVPLWTRIEHELRLYRGPPYWALAWAGGLALARYVVDHPELVVGRRVLDFASGSGLTAIAAAKGGAAHVLAADIDPLAVIALSLNADLNGLTIEGTIDDLLDEESRFDPASVDVVLVGDVFYAPDLAARSLVFLARCRAVGCEVLIGDPGRAALPVARLEKVNDQAVPVTRGCQFLGSNTDTELQATAVWRLVA
jgi:predicted nicotinamide N-methyase